MKKNNEARIINSHTGVMHIAEHLMAEIYDACLTLKTVSANVRAYSIIDDLFIFIKYTRMGIEPKLD